MEGREKEGGGEGGGEGKKIVRPLPPLFFFFFFFFLESVSHIGDEKTTNRGMGLRPGKTKVCDWKKMF